MNKLVEIFIRWRSHSFGFHTDIQKMYNCVKLHNTEWCFQRYLWRNDLDEKNPVEEKIIKTLIYGVKSSGNQSEIGLRKTAGVSKEEFPEVNEIVCKDVYVDDCLSGEVTKEKALQRADELELVLQRGGFSLKGISMTGSNPPSNLSSDGKTIGVAGLTWEPKSDLIYLDVKEINFAKKHRGRKTQAMFEIPENLTRRHCTAKLGEVFDLTGMFTPVIATMKLDLHELVVRKLDWDDKIPDNLRHVWVNHFQMMSELNQVKFKRAIVPHDAINLDVQTLCFGDASKDLACIAIYVRFKRKSNSYSCQLVFARSRLIPNGMSQPRAELYAAVVNCHSSEIVSRALYKHHKCKLLFTDSQIVLYWLSNENRSLKQWVRNRVLEDLRFSLPQHWRYIHTNEMIADLGTRRGAKATDVDGNSDWVNGMSWMTLNEEDFPAYTVNDIKLNSNQLNEARKEKNLEIVESSFFQNRVPIEVKDRYLFSQYLVDPNKFRFRNVVRIMALVIKFIRKLKEQSKPQINKNKIAPTYETFSDGDLAKAENYYFEKATREVKHFLRPHQYQKISKEKDGILYYSGRTLPEDEVTIVGKMTCAMKDLKCDSFCVPIVEKNSPLAFSIVSEIHCYNESVKHAGIESVWRYVLKKVFIIEGRSIVKIVKRSCQRCRYLEKKKLEVIMGPVSQTNLTIAPAFYHTQVDITGPYDAYSPHHKRTTVKIWLVVFCCNNTSATSIKVMENYSSTAFVQAFVRLSCLYGYPNLLLSDEGSQLVKAFQSMELNYVDVQQKLHKNQIKYELCPVGGHNMNGRVERKIKEIKTSLEKNLSKQRLSIMQWETVILEIVNNINNLPLSLGNYVGDFETMDLITPNRLIMGRNNDRNPIGSIVLSNDPLRIIRANNAVFDAWFENWLLVHVPKLMIHPKWFKSDEDLQKGDIVLFLKSDSSLSSTYQYGIIQSVHLSKDGKIRKAEVKYKNQNESIFRVTNRAVRELVVIHRVNEIDITEELMEKSK